MSHIKEEQISAYIDEQLSSEEKLALDAHLSDCESCRTIRDEMLEVSHLFRKAERFEPSPFLWNRIEVDFNKESPTHHWISSFLIAGLRKNSWTLRLASAAMVVLVAVGVVVFRGNSTRIAEQAALADIDRAYQSLATLDPDTYNPFGSSLPGELDTNPFRSMRLSSEGPGMHRLPRNLD